MKYRVLEVELNELENTLNKETSKGCIVESVNLLRHHTFVVVLKELAQKCY